MKQIELPDFDDMFKLADEIGKLTREKLILEHRIEIKEAEVVKRVVSDPRYFINGKTPSMEFVKTTYLKTGVDTGEIDEVEDTLVAMKANLNIKISDLERAKLRFQIYRDMIDVWRTVSANQRAAVA